LKERKNIMKVKFKLTDKQEREEEYLGYSSIEFDTEDIKFWWNNKDLRATVRCTVIYHEKDSYSTINNLSDIFHDQDLGFIERAD